MNRKPVRSERPKVIAEKSQSRIIEQNTDALRKNSEDIRSFRTDGVKDLKSLKSFRRSDGQKVTETQTVVNPVVQKVTETQTQTEQTVPDSRPVQTNQDIPQLVQTKDGALESILLELEIIDETLTGLREDVLKELVEVQEWLELLTEKPEAPVPETPVFPAVVQEKPQIEMAPPEIAPGSTEEKPDADFQSGVLEKLGAMNDKLSSVAGTVFNILTGITLQTVKFVGLLLAGIVAIEMLVAVMKSVWNTYGEDIKKVWAGITDTIGDLTKWFMGVWDSLGLSRMFTAITNLATDIADGNIWHGLGKYLDTLMNVWMDTLSNLLEGVLSLVPGTEKVREAIATERGERRLKRGDELTEREREMVQKSRETEAREEREAVIDREVTKLLAEKQKNGELGWYTSEVDRQIAREEVIRNNPELQKESSIVFDYEKERAVNKYRRTVETSSDIASASDIRDIQRAEELLKEKNVHDSEVSDLRTAWEQKLERRNERESTVQETNTVVQAAPVTVPPVQTTVVQEAAPIIASQQTINNSSNYLMPASRGNEGFTLRSSMTY